MRVYDLQIVELRFAGPPQLIIPLIVSLTDLAKVPPVVRRATRPVIGSY